MKIIYEFDPYEDKEELETYQKAGKNACKLYAIEMYIRKLSKYDNRTEISIDELKETIYNIINEE